MFIAFALLVFSIIASLVVIVYLPTAGWSSYKSNHVPLSFRYPKDWPVSQCSDPVLFPQMKIEEMISFKDECDWGQYENSIGNITVEKLDGNTDPHKLTNSAFLGGNTRTLEPMKIGNMDGYSLIVKPTPKIPYSIEKIYYVVANNLVYEIRLLRHTFYKGSETETTKTFERMLSTFQF